MLSADLFRVFIPCHVAEVDFLFPFFYPFSRNCYVFTGPVANLPCPSQHSVYVSVLACLHLPRSISLNLVHTDTVHIRLLRPALLAFSACAFGINEPHPRARRPSACQS